MTATRHPHREPLRTTLLRTIFIAVVAGTALAAWSALSWFVAVVLVLWISFGGHWVEVAYLDWLKPRLPARPAVQRVARVGVWFVGGCGLGVAMALTARALGGMRHTQWPAWWVVGVAFIGVELVAHAALQLRGRPSFFDGRG